ncbi:MAG: restriction endonuclease subunit S [Acinetobacter sp.]
MSKILTLADCVLSANTGLDAIKRAPIVTVNTGIRCIRIQDISQSKAFEDWGFTEVTSINFEKFQLKSNDIFIARTGGSIGVNIFISTDLQAVYNNGLIRIRVDTEKFHPKFIYFILRSDKYREHINSIAFGTAAQPNMKIKDFLSFELIEIPLYKQKQIVKILSDLDDKIQLNNQINRTLESIAQAIFKSWFIDFDPVRAKIEARQEGKDPVLAAMCVISGKSEAELRQMAKEDFAELQATAALFPDELVESELGDVPKGWEYKKLKDLCRVINGRAYKNTEFKEEGIPIVRIQNLTGGGKTVFSDLDLPQDKLIEKEDFIYAWSATFGPYIWRGPKSIYHYHIWKMDVDETIISRYFLYLTMFRKTESMKSAGTGSIFTHLTKVIMESQDVLIADNAINMLFKDRIDKIFKLISLNSDEIKNLENIRDTLLPKLLSGELDVSDLGSETEYEYSTE